MPLPMKKKSNKKRRTLYKMYNMKDYFFKYWQYYILFFEKKKENRLVTKRSHFIDIYSVLLKFYSPCSSQLPSLVMQIATTSVQT